MFLRPLIAFAPENEGGTPSPEGSSVPAADTSAGAASPAAPVDAGPDKSSAIPDNVMGGDDLDHVELPEPTPAPEKPVALEAQPDPAKPGEQKPAEPKAPAAEAKPAPKPGTEAAPTDGQAKPATPASAQPDILSQLDVHKKDIISHLAGERFGLSQEESDLLDVNPTAAVSQIMARTFYESQVATINQINAMVPRIIAEVTKSLSTADEAEKGFYAANTDLNAKEHGPIVGSFAKVFRQMNPAASKEDAYKFVSNAVRAHLGLAAPVGNGAAPAAGKPAVPAPFTPARGGVKVISTTPAEDPFAGLGMEFDDE